MQECDGTCGDIYSSDELTKFPCLHALCGMCLNECSLVVQHTCLERDGKFLCPMRECKYLSSKTLHMQQSTVTATDSNSDEKRKNPTEASYDPSSSSTEAVSKLRASKLSESESDEEHINND
uniref:RING-type domain-containing protein n=1 Tax=Setaria digitata TaxID=48799 RepID=A0A915PHK7_9BILA